MWHIYLNKETKNKTPEFLVASVINTLVILIDQNKFSNNLSSNQIVIFFLKVTFKVLSISLPNSSTYQINFSRCIHKKTQLKGIKNTKICSEILIIYVQCHDKNVDQSDIFSLHFLVQKKDVLSPKNQQDYPKSNVSIIQK